MQTVNDDMDSLMRKAGVDYPLFTGNADFSKVAAAMESVEETSLPKKSYVKYLGLILVLLLPWLITQFDPQELKGTGSVTASAENLRKQVLDKGQELTQENQTAGEQAPANTPNRIIATHPQANSVSTTTRTQNRNETKPGLINENELPDKNIVRNTEQANSLPQIAETNPKTAEENKNLAKNQTPIPGSAAEKNEIKSKTETTVGVKTPEGSLNKEEASKVSSPANTTQPRKKFYIGLVGGINATTIKMQEVKEVGSDFGFIAGYKFLKVWSIETGILSSSKYYYSDGEYLNNPKIYLPPNTKITAVEGDCRMIEIPLVLKYDFGFKKAHNWFATAGISSFLMKEEDYAYDYYYTASGTTHTYNKTYENESKDWAAVMQISAGYMRSIPLGMNVRIEPFIQIPLKGAGYGNLPLTSAGLRLGITRSLF
jgi:hypothetical protein